MAKTKKRKKIKTWEDRAFNIIAKITHFSEDVRPSEKDFKRMLDDIFVISHAFSWCAHNEHCVKRAQEEIEKWEETLKDY